MFLPCGRAPCRGGYSLNPLKFINSYAIGIIIDKKQGSGFTKAIRNACLIFFFSKKDNMFFIIKVKLMAGNMII